MFTILHNFHPQAIFISFGVFHIYWYGLFVVLGILAALGVSFFFAKYYFVNKDSLFDLSFWLIINGLIGARVYDIFLQLPYYIQNPLAIFKIWQGGLAIHGGIIAGIITVYLFSRNQKISPWRLSALVVPGLALAQAIGRWGNYFNQELFGFPTNRPWGIPIDLLNRPLNYITANYFQPTFLYESLGCFIIFIFLCLFNYFLIKKQLLIDYYFVWMVSLYVVLYSMLRFGLEFIRLDEAPLFLTLRWPQLISLILIFISSLLIIFNPHAKTKKN